MDHVDRASGLIEQVRAAGVNEFCVCAGSRNSALLAVLGASDARLFPFVDERSAAFFALGRAKAHGQPVAIVTTSGTAAAELLPAAIEAFYSGIALVLITADRPSRFRGTGAPQSIEQRGIFGVYAETSLANWSRTRPLHLNVELEEYGSVQPPLDEDETLSPANASPAARSVAWPHGRPLVVVGGLAASRRARVREFLLRANAPAYAEPLSGLREDESLPLITAGERMIPRARFDYVIRLGNVPALRFWRDLEERDTPVVHFSDLPFPGLTRGEVHPLDALPRVDGARDEEFFARDREQAARIAAVLDEEPQSELALFRALSRELAPGTRVYLGNSLPIREWDLAATREPRGFEYEANRGANGIDGQLSTFFGWCDPSRDNVCVLGDLTTIYDLNAPWIVPQLGHRRFRVVVMNNGGGRIFSRVASLRALDAGTRQRLIENTHDVRFDHWAAMWNIDVTELRPDAGASKRAWERYDALWS